MRAGLEARIKLEQWREAAECACNLSELSLLLGEVAKALEDAEKCITYADRSGDLFMRMVGRLKAGVTLHQLDRRTDSEALCREIEREFGYPLLGSFQGFWYYDLLLTEAERVAWQMLENTGKRQIRNPKLIEFCRAIEQRAALPVTIDLSGYNLLEIALNHLTLGRVELYRAALENSAIGNSRLEIEQAVSGLRRAGDQAFIPFGLLTRAWLRFLTGARTGPGSAQEDLDEAWKIAERGPMKLFLADIHLHRARLFFREPEIRGTRIPMELRAAPRTISPPHANSSKCAVTGVARKSLKMPKRSSAAFEMVPAPSGATSL